MTRNRWSTIIRIAKKANQLHTWLTILPVDWSVFSSERKTWYLLVFLSFCSFVHETFRCLDVNSECVTSSWCDANATFGQRRPTDFKTILSERGLVTKSRWHPKAWKSNRDKKYHFFSFLIRKSSPKTSKWCSFVVWAVRPFKKAERCSASPPLCGETSDQVFFHPIFKQF